MKKWFLISFTLVACQADNGERKSLDNFDFSTFDDSELFFKNLRQSEYDKTEMKEAGMDIFRMSDRRANADYPLVHLAIANNWRNDKAFIMVEPNEQLGESFKLTAPGLDNFEYEQGNTKTQLELALWLFDAIRSEKQIMLEGSEPIFDKAHDREVLRRTMVDYERLVRLRP